MKLALAQHTAWPALKIENSNKRCWHVELIFQWLQQTLNRAALIGKNLKTSKIQLIRLLIHVANIIPKHKDYYNKKCPVAIY